MVLGLDSRRRVQKRDEDGLKKTRRRKGLWLSAVCTATMKMIEVSICSTAEQLDNDGDDES